MDSLQHLLIQLEHEVCIQSSDFNGSLATKISSHDSEVVCHALMCTFYYLSIFLSRSLALQVANYHCMLYMHVLCPFKVSFISQSSQYLSSIMYGV